MFLFAFFSKTAILEKIVFRLHQNIKVEDSRVKQFTKNLWNLNEISYRKKTDIKTEDAPYIKWAVSLVGDIPFSDLGLI